MKRFLGFETAKPSRICWQVGLIYFLVASAWFLISDRLILDSYRNPWQFTRLHSLKDWFFVLVSAGLLSWLVCYFLQALQRKDRKLLEIAQGVSVTSGKTFFFSLVRHLAQALEVEGAFIFELSDAGRKRMKTLGAFVRGRNVPSLECEWEGTPCEEILKTRKLCCFPEGVGKLFPFADLVRRYKVESFIGTPLVDSSGRAVGLMAVMDSRPLRKPGLAEDILTMFALRAAVELDREQTRYSLEQSEERFRFNFDQAGLGMANVGLDGVWQRVNRRFCDILGYSAADELLGKSFQKSVFPKDLEAIQEYDRKLLTGELGSYSLKKRYLRKDGTPVWTKSTVALLRERSERPSCFILIVEDITEQKMIEDERDRLLAELEATLNSVADAVICYDLEGNILRMNPEAEKTLRYSPEERKKTLKERMVLWQAETPKGEPFSLEQSIRRGLGGEEVPRVTFKVRRGDRTFWVYGSVTPLKTRDGRILGAVGTFTDVTSLYP